MRQTPHVSLYYRYPNLYDNTFCVVFCTTDNQEEEEEAKTRLCFYCSRVI